MKVNLKKKLSNISYLDTANETHKIGIGIIAASNDTAGEIGAFLVLYIGIALFLSVHITVLYNSWWVVIKMVYCFFLRCFQCGPLC